MISKTFLSIRTIFKNSLLFSTIGKQAPNFTFPKRWEITQQASNQAYTAITTSRNTRSLAYVLENNLRYMTDQYLGLIYLQLIKLNNGIDNSFYNSILPITKQYVTRFTRENATALGRIALSLSVLRIQQPDLWKLVLKKLHDESIYRYITLRDTVQLLEAIVDHGLFVRHPIVQKLKEVIQKQKLYYMNYPDLMVKISIIIPKLASKLAPKQAPRQLDQKKKELTH